MRFNFVGVDAHIDPAAETVFTEICGEFEAARDDVGIVPYGIFVRRLKKRRPWIVASKGAGGMRRERG